MEFEWDEAKNRQNIAKHGISFERASTIFEHFHITREDTRYDYGEVREISIGELVPSVIIVVVHTNRSGRIRLISARRANTRERRHYEEEIRKRIDD